MPLLWVQEWNRAICCWQCLFWCRLSGTLSHVTPLLHINNTQSSCSLSSFIKAGERIKYGFQAQTICFVFFSITTVIDYIIFNFVLKVVKMSVDWNCFTFFNFFKINSEYLWFLESWICIYIFCALHIFLVPPFM